MLTEHQNSLEIRAITCLELYQFCDILMEAANWAEHTGEQFWTGKDITPHALLAKYRLDEMFLGFSRGVPVAAMVLNNQTHSLQLDEKSTRESMFMRKLTVRRDYAGVGYAKQMVDWSRRFATERGYTLLNLICECNNQRLRWTLGQFGFNELDGVNGKGKPTRFFQLDLDKCAIPISKHAKQSFAQELLSSPTPINPLLN
ncbi:GNAT family N-acetyltransferase [Aliagarivorans taiwanensis]|uniref:GNAT family N-acetyltransferase n=1 Tax=Aliagarivorans taiwanensis TaxID=561966 RepID=UPI00040A261A|nr:GNAT family N-acetyltransferase [Aliagarivorans taiwanensis]